MIIEHFYRDQDKLFTALHNHCLSALQTAVNASGVTAFLVSGGSTPAPLYRRLAQTGLPDRVTVALVDERWVASGHPGNNEAMIRGALQITGETLVGMKTEHTHARDAVTAVEARYQALPKPAALTLLGMGLDGHTASLFPAAEGLAEALDTGRSEYCCAIKAKASEVTGDLTERLSLTLTGILSARELVLLITGEEKLAVYQQARRSVDINATPVSAVLQQENVPVHVYWAP